jgi:hypothetical protein
LDKNPIKVRFLEETWKKSLEKCLQTLETSGINLEKILGKP